MGSWKDIPAGLGDFFAESADVAEYATEPWCWSGTNPDCGGTQDRYQELVRGYGANPDSDVYRGTKIAADVGSVFAGGLGIGKFVLKQLFKKSMKETAGKVAKLPAQAAGLPDVDGLLAAGKQIDPKDKRGEYTRAGRALMKHSGRKGNPNGWPIPDGKKNPQAWNETGQSYLEDLLNSKDITVTTRHHGTHGDIVDYRYNSSGMGARFKANGDWVGFVDPSEFGK